MSGVTEKLQDTQEIAEHICRVLMKGIQPVPEFPEGKVPVAVASRVMGKSPTWIIRKMHEGKLPIGICDEGMSGSRLDAYINPKLFWEYTGYVWKGEKK